MAPVPVLILIPIPVPSLSVAWGKSLVFAHGGAALSPTAETQAQWSTPVSTAAPARCSLVSKQAQCDHDTQSAPSGQARRPCCAHQAWATGRSPAMSAWVPGQGLTALPAAGGFTSARVHWKSNFSRCSIHLSHLVYPAGEKQMDKENTRAQRRDEDLIPSHRSPAKGITIRGKLSAEQWSA